ncbi:MAG: hypothetical protein V2B18_25945 [Pseudomonadota bacterium]
MSLLHAGLCCMVVSSFVITWQFIVGSWMGVGGYLFVFVFPVLCVICGRLFAWCFDYEAMGSVVFCLQFPAGVILLNLLLLTAVVVPGPYVAALFVLLSALGLGAYYFRKARWSPEPLSEGRWNLAVVFLAFVGASIWTQTGIIQREPCGTDICFLPWSDYLIHSGLIARLREAAFNGGPFEFQFLAGVRPPFYHYTSYMLPAAFLALDGAPAVNLATSFWLPLGVALSGISAFGLARRAWGSWEGVASVVGVIWFLAIVSG